MSKELTLMKENGELDDPKEKSVITNLYVVYDRVAENFSGVLEMPNHATMVRMARAKAGEINTPVGDLEIRFIGAVMDDCSVNVDISRSFEYIGPAEDEFDNGEAYDDALKLEENYESVPYTVVPFVKGKDDV